MIQMSFFFAFFFIFFSSFFHFILKRNPKPLLISPFRRVVLGIFSSTSQCQKAKLNSLSSLRQQRRVPFCSWTCKSSLRRSLNSARHPICPIFFSPACHQSQKKSVWGGCGKTWLPCWCSCPHMATLASPPTDATGQELTNLGVEMAAPYLAIERPVGNSHEKLQDPERTLFLLDTMPDTLRYSTGNRSALKQFQGTGGHLDPGWAINLMILILVCDEYWNMSLVRVNTL